MAICMLLLSSLGVYELWPPVPDATETVQAATRRSGAIATDSSYQWFLSLVASGIELPHALVQQHTLIAQPYGRFEGVELHVLADSLRLIVIRQTDAECVRHFLLTGDQTRVLDQALLAHRCRRHAGDAEPPQPHLTYRFKGERELEQLQVSLALDPHTQPEAQLKRIFRCAATGRIVVQTIPSRGLRR